MIKISEEQRQKMHEIIKRELASGKTKEDIFAMGEKVEVDKKDIQQAIEDIEKDDNKTFWDIAGDGVALGDFDKANKINIEFLKQLRKYPNALRWVLFFCCIPVVVIFFILIRIAFLIFFYDQEVDLVIIFVNAFQLFAASLAPALIYYVWIPLYQVSLVSYVIALDQKWVYSPKFRRRRWTTLKKTFPEIFDKGDMDQNISNEIWGEVFLDNKKESFWTGKFAYVTKKRKLSNSYKRTVFGFRLNKKLNTRFCLKPDNAIAGFFRRKKEIDLESIEFNKAFAVYYNGKKEEKELEITKTLLPSLQTRLIEMRNSEGDFDILFAGDVMIFSFKGKLLKKMKTNLIKDIKIEPKDTELLKKRFKNVANLGFDIARFLD